MEKWLIYALLAMLFAGFTSVVAKFGMQELNSDTALAVRTAVVFAIVVFNAFVFRNAAAELRTAPSSNLIFLAISGITTSLSWIFFYRAIKAGPVSVVVSIDKASIVVALLLSFILLKEPVTAKVLTGAGFIVVGMVILLLK